MHQTAIPIFWPALPEIFLLVMICITLLVELFATTNKTSLTFWFTQLSLIGAGFITVYFYEVPTTYTFSNMYLHDTVASLLKIFIYLTSFFSFIYARQYIKDREIQFGEYYVLGLFVVLGMSILVSANSLLILFLGLELLSLPLYAMVALYRSSGIASEAAMKYYIMGAMATGILLYGMSMLYGATGTLNIEIIAKTIPTMNSTNQLMMMVGLVFIITGVFFKLGAAPFHMWAPDVYHGAPTPVTLFLGSAPKIAAFGLAIRLLVNAMPGFEVQWQEVLIVIAIASMSIGNIVAIIQSNIKRLLAYSSIAHMGYMSLGLLSASKDGYASAMFYMIIYAIMSMGAFAVVTIMSHAGFEAESIDDYKGLNSRNPWLAFMMLLIMFSMAGIPPTVGFFAKLGVLEALVDAHLVWLAALALVFAVIGSYYYLRIVKVMYFEEPVTKELIVSQRDMQVAVTINSVAIVILGLFPTTIIDLCRAAFSSY